MKYKDELEEIRAHEHSAIPERDPDECSIKDKIQAFEEVIANPEPAQRLGFDVDNWDPEQILYYANKMGIAFINIQHREHSYEITIDSVQHVEVSKSIVERIWDKR